MDDHLVYVLLDWEHMEVIGVYSSETLCHQMQAAYEHEFGVHGHIQMRRMNETLDMLVDEDEGGTVEDALTFNSWFGTFKE